jgi:hypothetical protein
LYVGDAIADVIVRHLRGYVAPTVLYAGDIVDSTKTTSYISRYLFLTLGIVKDFFMSVGSASSSSPTQPNDDDVDDESASGATKSSSSSSSSMSTSSSTKASKAKAAAEAIEKSKKIHVAAAPAKTPT